MKIKFTLGLLTLCFGMFVMMSHSGGRASQFGEGNTGAPGDNPSTCATCHQGGNFGADITIELLDNTGTAVTEYLPGKTYTVNAKVNTTSTPVGYGLQLVSLIDNGTKDTGGLSAPSANAKIANANSRNYLEQKSLSSSPLFSATWTAPAVGSGKVSFYAAGHAANGNGNTNGDQATKTSISFEESTTTSIIDEKALALTIAPNPTSGFTTISWNDQSETLIQVITITGQIMHAQTTKNSSLIMDVTNFNPGVYFVKVTETSTNVSATQRLVVR